MFMLGDCLDWRTSRKAVSNWQRTWLGVVLGSLWITHRQASILEKKAGEIWCG